jgi:uncharacterized alpha-E superfamily protein
MLSRVADSIYWMSRYIERAENLARLLGVGYELELDASAILVHSEDGKRAKPVEGVLAMLGCRESFGREPKSPDLDSVLRFLTFDRKNSQSIISMIESARENARATQQIVGAEVWSQVNRLYLSLGGQESRRRLQASPPRFYANIKRSCMLWNGVIDNTLVRDEVYYFLELGRYLERVDLVCRTMLVHAGGLGEPEGDAQRATQSIHCTHLLQCCAAYESFLRTHNERLDPRTVVQFLILDGEFPRAIRFGVARCRRSLQQIAGAVDGDYGSEAERLLGRLDGELRYVDVTEIFERGLTEYLAGLQEVCHRIGEEVHRAYFAA